MTVEQICFLLVALAAIVMSVCNISLRRRLVRERVFYYCSYCLLKNLTELDDEALANAVVLAGIENGIDTEEFLWEIGTWET